jgi:DNA-binding transcriptional LysR family regulator
MDSPLNLRSVDLNLLVFFDALISERHVTRAASKVAVSQSAMSNALARLRHVFRDELFVRTAKGMEPTPRAVELGPEVRSILQQTTRLMASDVQFDAASAQRAFTCRMSDLVGTLMLPSLLSLLQIEAPKLTLEVVHLSPDDTVAALEADRLDVAVSMHLRHGRTIRAEPLFADRMVCLMREGHPLTEGAMTLRKLLTYGHVRVAMSPTDLRFVDSVLAPKEMQRHVVLTVPHWLLVPRVLASTDLVSVISERAARTFQGTGMVTRRLPYASERFWWTMYWHRRHEHSRAHTWLRECVKRSTRAVD